jgi:hypothetical protein
MGTTPVFGFPYPDPSDLVANYPALAQQLAEDVEDEIIASGGLVFISATAFSAVASISVNNVFTASYDNYRVIVNATPSNGIGLNFRLRAAGSDASGTNYTWGAYTWNQTSITYDAGSASTNLIQTSFLFATYPFLQTIDIGSPALAVKTQVASRVTSESSTPAIYNYVSSGLHRLTTAYDGFTVLASAGTITGTVRVYGYKN